MFQRIQTLFSLGYIALTLASVLMFSSGIRPELESFKLIANSVPYILSGVAFISMFLFSRRAFQIKLNSLILVLAVFSEIGMLLLSLKQIELIEVLLSIHYLLVFVSWISLVLANRYIRKDEALIRSVDRLR